MSIKARVLLSLSTAAFLLPFGLHAQTAAAPNAFALHDGDRVTFYGDSITEQREYTEDVEAFVLTRFPKWKVIFHNAGVGGDKVSGGWGGPIDLRLDRDVLAYKSTIVTVMLGMNDGYYRASEPGIQSTYTAGYLHLVDTIQKSLPEARITLIQPSPYDDVTRTPLFAGGYNAVMQQYGQFITQTAREKSTQVTDFNAPVVAILQTLNQQSPNLAQQLIPDRVHPGQGGHWIMAESLLKTWTAPEIVSSVTIAANPKSSPVAQNAQITDIRRAKDRISWTETENALPLPLPSADLDPVLGLVVKYSDLVAALDQEQLHVAGFTPGRYDLRIDGRSVGTFSESELAAGINLATLQTPMLEQSLLVAYDVGKKNAIEAAYFKVVYASLEAESSPIAKELATALTAAENHERADAQPRSHNFEVVRQP